MNNHTTSKKPLIGINTGVRDIEKPDQPFFTVRTTYTDAIHAAGGVPILVPAVEDPEIIAAHADLCDGFIFTGGPDLDPTLYGQEVHEKVKDCMVHKRRENYDLALIKQVLARKKPFLAICLGCQEVNVVLGGTLIQDIPSVNDTEIDHAKSYSRHDVEVKPGTLLASIVGEGTLLANTSHHQCVDKPGEGCVITSYSPTDNIPESFELTDYPFGLALQWHPEVIHDEPKQLAMFQALVKASAGV